MKKLRHLKIRSLKHLCFHLAITRRELDWLSSNAETHYRTQHVSTNGKRRELHVPQGQLMIVLKRLNSLLQRLEFPEYMQGSLRGRSNIANAAAHCNKPVLVCADIKDFYPTISSSRVERIFRVKLGCSPEVSRMLTKLCTCKGALPQGAPTSPVLANLAIEHLAYRLHGLAESRGAEYSQYLDDVAISGPVHLEKLKPLVTTIIEQEGFCCHPEKLRVVGRQHEQVVTGARVDHGMDAPSEKVKEVRALIVELTDEMSNGRLPSLHTVRSIEGKIRYIRRLNRGTGKFLWRQLKPLHEALLKD